jgi:hypothetical protein
MFEIIKHDDGIIEISYEGHFSAEDWEEYKVLMTKCLDEADGKICILSDFSETLKPSQFGFFDAAWWQLLA